MRLIKLAGFYLDYLRLKRQAKASGIFLPFGKFYPFLDERDADSGSTSGHYFHQDLLVASRIFQNNPELHVDIGSRIDGFVAHVATFREIEVVDLRPMRTWVPNIIFKQADFMHDNLNLKNYCDSVSSLHAIEHFGLGRYGDRLDYNGHLKGLNNIYRMLKEGGKFYFSAPIGKQRIEFNAHRVFDVKYLLDLIQDKYRIDYFSYVNDSGELFKNTALNPKDIEKNYGCHYGCGIFELTKKAEDSTSTATEQALNCSEPIMVSSPRSTVFMLKHKIKNIIHKGRYNKTYQKWECEGKPLPTPHAVKQMTVRQYAVQHKAEVFIETGTYLGEMVNSIKYNFKEIYSIELSSELYEKTKRKFSRYKNIKIFNGDSAKVLSEILEHLYEPCLFWLDAHYSEGITVKGDKETPILDELERIFSHPVDGHVILIDDARFFTGNNDYPSLQEVKRLITTRYPDYIFSVKDDIIRAHKN